MKKQENILKLENQEKKKQLEGGLWGEKRLNPSKITGICLFCYVWTTVNPNQQNVRQGVGKKEVKK